MLSPALSEGSSPDPSLSLLSRVAGGDESALGELFESVGPRVARVLADLGSRHGVQSTTGGCLLFIVSSLHDELGEALQP